MHQLTFPHDFVLPPQVPEVGSIPGLDHIYVLTVKQKYPERYEFASKWAKDRTDITLWPGILPEQMTQEDWNLSRFIPDYGHKHLIAAIGRDHYKIWSHARENNYQKVLILEDDAILAKNFTERLIKDVAAGVGDIIYLGDACGWHGGNGERQVAPGLFHKTGGDSRALDSYILNRKAIETLGQHFDNGGCMDYIVDYWMKTFAQRYNLLVLWSEPTYVTQGSLRGVPFYRKV